MTKKYVDIYNMTSDTNFGPHHDGELLSLACCMVYIRKKVGDLWTDLSNPEQNLEYWIVGRVASSLSSKKKNHLVYFMKVDDVMNFAEYSKEFELRKDGNGRKDNIYEVEDESGDCFDPNNFDKIIKDLPKHTPEHDIGKGRYVLLSRNYCYFDWRENPYKEKLGEWGISELEWHPPCHERAFRRKFNFEEKERIIKKIKKIKEKHCRRHIPNGNGCREVGDKR